MILINQILMQVTPAENQSQFYFSIMTGVISIVTVKGYIVRVML